MSSLQAEVYEASRSIDVSEEKAIRAATALSAALGKVEDDAISGFSKRDADIDAARRDLGSIKLDIVTLKGELALHRWMLGSLLAMQVAVLFKLFSH